MADRVIELLADCPDGVFVDATVGLGGHLKKVIEAHGSRFEYYGFDLDGKVLEQTKKNISETGIEARLIKSNYTEIVKLLQKERIRTISAIVYDLGIGSFQIDDPARGFSYLGDGPLSMAFDDELESPAADLINRLNETELMKLLRKYGQEPRAKAISRAIKSHSGGIATTGQLADIIRTVVGSRFFIKTASRVFQAIRVEVNHEFENISRSLDAVLPCLAERGRAIVITYHSLEDGIVKRIFKKYTGGCVCPAGMKHCMCGKIKMVRKVFPKPLKAEPEEVAANIRARSAKLRAVERIAVET
jgi:16S rRNA (cytosine1402-N4)-methyltransferase